MKQSRVSTTSSLSRAQKYYHASFKTYPRNKVPTDLSTRQSLITVIHEQYPTRARVAGNQFNAIVASWQKPATSFLTLQPFSQEESIGDDGLMVQSTFDAIIDDDQYLMQLYPDPYLFFSTMPDESELTKHYRKLLDSIMPLQMKKN
jgi:hypothetical protein